MFSGYVRLSQVCIVMITKIKCKWKLILARSRVFQIIDIAKSGTLIEQHVCCVLKGGGSEGESVTGAIAFVVAFSSTILIIQHYSLTGLTSNVKKIQVFMCN